MEIKIKNKIYTAIKSLSFLMLVLSLIFCALILLLSYLDGFNVCSFVLTLVSIIPTLLSFFITKKIKYETKKSIKICGAIISIILFVILILYLLIGITIFVFAQETTSIEPTKSRYSYYLANITEDVYKIEHFPQIIPNNAKDYYFLIERGGKGYWIHYLKFKTDEVYIKNTIDKNKDNIYKKIEFNKIGKYYKYIDKYFDIKDKDNAFVYILKNKNNNKNYTSGMVTTKSNEIVFFYANHNIEL